MSKFIRVFSIIAVLLSLSMVAQAAGGDPAYKVSEHKELGLKKDQYAKFPKPLKLYDKARIEKEGRRAQDKPEDDAKDDESFRYHLFHFLGEVEAVFGIWIIALAGAVVYFFGIQDGSAWAGVKELQQYLGHDVNFQLRLFSAHSLRSQLL